MPAGKCRRPTRKRQRGGGDDDTQTRAHRTASGRKSTPCRASLTVHGGHAKKARSFREKLRTFSKKRPTFAQELRDFVPRPCAGQRNSESTVRQRADERPRMQAALRGRRGVRRATAQLRLRATRRWAAAGRRDPRQSALPHSKAGKGAEALRSTGGNSRCGSAARGAIRICVPTLGDFQGAWSRETRRCHTGAHALSRRRTRRLS